MPDQNPLLFVIHGPTASGKTSLAVALAKSLNTEVLSSDSRQFYREMSIGTAKPDEEEMAGVKHHFIDSLSVDDEYSAGDFERDALHLLDKLFQKNDVMIMVGGSGLYADAVTKGFDELPSDPEIREQLIRELEDKGIEVLQAELQKRDPEHFKNSDIQNPQRLVRALEVCRISQKPYSSFRSGEPKDRSFDILEVALHRPRKELYERIEVRVDQMMHAGLEAEAQALFSKKELPALNTVGYKELFDYFEGRHSKERAIELIKRNTRRFAKRQMTWFRKNESIHWIDAEPQAQALNKCLELISNQRSE
jgi:tRNA dimethylallyltransferase